MANINAKKRSLDKQLILDRASKLFWEHGYDRTSMRDIAVACGCEPGNLYNYFKSKEGLLFQVLFDELLIMVTGVRHLLLEEDGDPVEQLREYINNHFFTALTMPASSILYDVEIRSLSPKHKEKYISLRDEYEGILRKILKRGSYKGIFKLMDLKIAAFSILSILARTRIWYSPTGKFNKDQVVDLTWRFALNAIGYCRV